MTYRQSKNNKFFVFYKAEQSVISDTIPPLTFAICRESFSLYSGIFTPRQRAEGRAFQREPHAGGGEQRGQDQRGYQEPEGAVAEGTDRPEGHRAATAAGEAAKKKQ